MLKDCNQCDVCLERKRQLADEVSTCQTAILHLLADGEPHGMAEMQTLQLAKKDLEEALAQLLHEEQIAFDGTFMQQKK